MCLGSAPWAPMVKTAFLFAADIGCCAEKNRPVDRRRRERTSALPPDTQSRNFASTLPLPVAATYGTAAALADPPSGDVSGLFGVGHTADGFSPVGFVGDGFPVPVMLQGRCMPCRRPRGRGSGKGNGDILGALPLLVL